MKKTLKDYKSGKISLEDVIEKINFLHYYYICF
jgi:hypothetical protein